MPPFLLATVLTLASIAIAFGVVRGANLVRRTNAAWQGAADALGLAFQPKTSLLRYYSMEGDAYNFRFQIDGYRSTREEGRPYTRFKASFPQSLGLGLKATGIRFQFMGQHIQPVSIARSFGARTINTGDPAFDQLFLIKGADEEQVRKFLTPVRRAHLRASLQATTAMVEITDDQVTCSTGGILRDTESLIDQTRQLATLADLLTDFGADEQKASY